MNSLGDDPGKLKEFIVKLNKDVQDRDENNKNLQDNY